MGPRLRPADSALAIATPALRVKLYMPLAIPALRVLRKFKPKSFIHSYVKPKMLTHDFEQARLYASDELISPQIAVNILLDLYDTSTRLIRDAGAIQTPTLLLMSGNDWVVRKLPQHRLFARLSSPVKEKEVYPELLSFHVLGEGPAAADRADAAIRARSASTRRSRRRRCWTPTRPATRSACTTSSSARCATSPRRWNFAVQKLLLNTVGRLSEGVSARLADRFRFRRVARPRVSQHAGGLHVPRPLDRSLLPRLARLARHSPAKDQHAAAARRGDRAAPRRRQADSDSRHRRRAGPVRARHDRPASAAATSRRRSATATTAASRPAASWPSRWASRPSCIAQSNAFDREAIAAIEPRPNIAIVSGLYELFPANCAGARIARAAWRRCSSRAAC